MDRAPVNLWLVGQEGVDRQRGDRYQLESVRAHPGKMRPALARRLIETYTRPGDWVLDPMSGIGTTGVEAVHRGRHYVGIELEPRFVALQQENLEQARQQGATGQFTVLAGDARRLDAAFGEDRPLLPVPHGPVDAVLTSPPYGDRLRFERSTGSPLLRELIRRGEVSPSIIPAGYGSDPANLGNFAAGRYWEAMRHVYRGCYQALRPGGLLLIVLQPNRYRQHLQPLHHETARLCRQVGFEFLDELVAVLARIEPLPDGTVRPVAHASFFRRLALQRLRRAGHPVSLGQVEYVLVLRKPHERSHSFPRAHPRRKPDPNKDGLSAALAGPPLRSG